MRGGCVAEVRVHVPAPLRSHVAGEPTILVEATSLHMALGAVQAAYPALADRLLTDDGRVRPYVNLFLNGRDVRLLEADKLTIDQPADLTIVPSIAGGAPDLTREERLRYHRQLILPELGLEGQQRLRAASVLVVGAGGLGSPAALYLAAAGVGRIGIVDGDIVELSNLHRQILHDTTSVGTRKTTSAKARLEELNPDVEVMEIPRRLDASNALEILDGWDVVVDGTDNFPTRYVINDACVLLGIPLAYGAIFRFDGQASVFAASGGPCYRCLFRDPPPAALAPSCAEAGVLGALPGIVGSIQATETIKLITGMGTPLIGRLLLVDALGGEFRSLEIRRDPACVVCGDTPTLTDLVDFEAFCAESLDVDEPGAPFPIPAGFQLPVPFPAVDALELKEMIDRGKRLVLVDVRDPAEHAMSDLANLGAISLPMEELEERLEEIDPLVETILFCRTGRRSMEAVEFLHSRGYARVLNLSGGINGWARDVDPNLPTY
ncbi:MAG: molybdopterin-synthase adenylyltransferase MoeB [Gemmatimonadota bacterium]|nr:molybdopterin-synthase adenylyltransferase MoeB [Gemmatimonadota bacterium]